MNKMIPLPFLRFLASGEILGFSPMIPTLFQLSPEQLRKENWTTLRSDSAKSREAMELAKRGNQPVAFQRERSGSFSCPPSILSYSQDPENPEGTFTETILLPECYAEETNRLLYKLTHDFRAPIRHIEQFSELLSQPGLTDEETEKYRTFLTKSTQRVQKLLEDLVQLANISALTPEKKEVSLENIVDSIKDRLHEPLRKMNGSIVCAKLPKMVADPEALEILLEQLLRNSLASAKPGKALEIKIDAEETPEQIKIHFRDNGTGIDPAFLPKIFDFLERGRIEENNSNNGCGLAIAKRAIELHQGFIWCDELYSEGCSISFCLPKKPIKTES